MSDDNQEMVWNNTYAGEEKKAKGKEREREKKRESKWIGMGLVAFMFQTTDGRYNTIVLRCS